MCLKDEKCEDCDYTWNCPGPPPTPEAKVTNLKKEGCEVYIGRGSKWGNPFPMEIPTRKERDRVCDAYEEWFWTTDLPQQLHELKGKTLGCFCKPRRCHGDFLAREANKIKDQEERE